MNEQQIRELISRVHSERKNEYEAQKAILDGMDRHDLNFDIQNYITGYIKGMMKAMEFVKNAI
jgi:hypothetical protein